MLGDFMQHQAEQSRSQSGSHFLKILKELDCRWRGKDGEDPVGLEETTKLHN